MSDIHNLTGAVEQPLTTLGEELVPAAKALLEEALQKSPRVSGTQKRMRAAKGWVRSHPLESTLGFFALSGFVVYLGLSRLFTPSRKD